MDKNKLTEYIIRGMSSRDIAYKVGKSQTTVQYWLSKYELKTNPIHIPVVVGTACKACGKKLNKSNKLYCNHACQNMYQYQEYVKRWKSGNISGGKEVSKYIRHYLFEKYNNMCCRCKWNEKHPITGLVPLQIHHIDGDCLNTYESNLELLCPNCHSLTLTFGSLNTKGNGRRTRKLL
jgi:hypothetical protein